MLSEKRKKAEARKYLHEMRTQEQVGVPAMHIFSVLFQAKFSDEESDIPSRKHDVGVAATSTPLSSAASGTPLGRRLLASCDNARGTINACYALGGVESQPVPIK